MNFHRTTDFLEKGITGNDHLALFLPFQVNTIIEIILCSFYPLVQLYSTTFSTKNGAIACLILGQPAGIEIFSLGLLTDVLVFAMYEMPAKEELQLLIGPFSLK